ncbi:ChaN family lipoprotein [Nitrospira sp. M1]
MSTCLVKWPMSRCVRFAMLLGTLCLLLGLASCASAPGLSTEARDFQVGQIIEVKTGKVIEYGTLASELTDVDVVYIGEEHYTPSHIDAAVQVLNTLVDADQNPVLAMEMFSWNGQSALDQYTQQHALTQEQFLKDSHWEENWGSDFTGYERLVQFAKKHRLPLYALNPPRSLVRMVSKQGLEAALRDPEMEKWGVKKDMSLKDPEYEKVIFKPIELCHPGLPKNMYDRYYQASIFRDEGMAKIITEYVNRKSQDQGPLVSYTGGGHIQYEVPVPKRVRRDASSRLKDVSIYLIALDPVREEEVQEAIEEGIADYIWLRALGPNGPQPRCG